MQEYVTSSSGVAAVMGSEVNSSRPSGVRAADLELGREALAIVFEASVRAVAGYRILTASVIGTHGIKQRRQVDQPSSASDLIARSG
jgi:hypothetical protein